jgi:ATP-dependent DNA helicase RecG
VVLTLYGQVRDPRFVRFLEDVNRQLQTSFDVHDFLLIDLIHREETVPDPLRARLRRLVDLGVVETLGRGRGTRYLLARRFYSTAGQTGVYTRRKGLDRAQNKAILLKDIRSRSPQGCAMTELQQVLPP